MCPQNATGHSSVGMGVTSQSARTRIAVADGGSYSEAPAEWFDRFF
jgi:hypothetical protein